MSARETVGLLVITDGRKELAEQTIGAALVRLEGVHWARLVIVDDSGSYSYQAWLEARFGDRFTIVHHGDRQGLSGAIRSGWRQMADVDWVFHLEDDWVFPFPVDVPAMIETCREHGLAQVALKRQPVNPAEVRAGDFMAANPGVYEDRDGWLESGFGFTLNPCVYPAWVTDAGWPAGGGEAEFTARLRELAPGVRFGMVGSVGDAPRCLHIGHQRSAAWTL